MYGDIQVVALLLGDGGVRDRLGDPGQQAGAALLGGEASEQGGIPCGEGAYMAPATLGRDKSGVHLY